jgi:GT2 family glycosyltransferase/glycosyltransferase involved in cell wall biosynthesis
VRGTLLAVYTKLRSGRLDYAALASDARYMSSAANSEGSAGKGSGPSQKVPVLPDDLVVISGVPFDDIGGGQRGAQLARVALQTGRRVHYVHVYQKFDFEGGAAVHSQVDHPELRHLFIDDVKPVELFTRVPSGATVLIELPHPKILPFLEFAQARGIRVVFDLIDDWDTSLGGDWFNLDVFVKFVERCDVVVGSARVLVEKLRSLGRADAIYAPNAANEYIFDKYGEFARPIDLPNAERLAVYFGSLYGEWFAWDHIEAAAVSNPNTAFILIGDLARKPVLPSNVYFLGPKQIDELPGYLKHSDLALLPFVPGKISDAVSPIKVFEYLFLGKPVISTELPEIVSYPNLHVAYDREEFAALCGKNFLSENIDKDNDRFIMKNSWLARLERVCSSSVLNKKISVIILIHNNENIIERCLESFLFHLPDRFSEIIVVDNASVDRGADIIRSRFPSVKLVSNPRNGCASGRNLGATIASGEILAFFDSDQWLTGAAAFMEATSILENDASIGAVGWAAGWFNSHTGDVGGPIVDYLPNRAMNAEAQFHGYRSDIGYLGTGGMFVPRSVFQSIGGFDESYDPTCFEDTDFSFAIKKLGLRIAYRDLTGIRHQPHQTTGASGASPTYKALFDRNAEYFKLKWAQHPEFFTQLKAL